MDGSSSATGNGMGAALEGDVYAKFGKVMDT